VKICGITSVDAARVAVAAGADAIGLVTAARSPRAIDPENARAIADALPPEVTPVVVCEPGPDTPDVGFTLGPGTWVQVHGAWAEPPLEALARTHRVARGFRFDADAVRRWEACPGVHVLLVDGSSGGAGAAFDHAALAAMRTEITKPIVVAGGLDPDNVGAAITTVHPYAVDVSTGVESAPGVKDPARVRAFCDAVRAADAASG
jgi:phosphoribosylanthranilate isomerase